MVRETPYGIAVYPSVWKLLGIAAFSFALTVAAIQYLQQHHTVFGAILGYGGIGLFGLGGLFCLVRLFSFQPVLATSTEGIRIDLSLFGLRRPIHLWDHISAITIQKHPPNVLARLLDDRDLIVVYGDIADILDRASPEDEANPEWERALRAEFIGFQNIPTLYLPMKAGDLVRLIAQRNASEIARYGIVVRDTPAPVAKRRRRR